MTHRLFLPPIIRHARVSTEKRDLARRFRREATASERAAWELLRNRRCYGLKFRRQQPIRGYVVDFYCAELRLAVEIDGPIHQSDERLTHDLERLERLHDHGVRVLHIANHDVPHLPTIIQRLLGPPLSREGEGEGG